MIKKVLLLTALMLAFVMPQAHASNLFKLVPQEADFVFLINVSRFMANESIKQAIDENLKSNPEQSAGFFEFVEATGFNPLENLQQAVVFTSGQVDSDVSGQLAGVLFRGDFNREKIFEAMKNNEDAMRDVSLTKIDGFHAVVPNDPQQGYGIFIDDNTAVIGAQLGAMAVKDVKLEKRKSVVAREDFFAIIKRMNPNATLSGAGQVPDELKARVKENPQAAPLASVDHFFFSFDFGDNIRFIFNGKVDKEENTNQVLTSLNGFLAMLKMFAGQAPEAGEILNLVNISSDKDIVRISLNVPQKKLQEIREKMENRMQEMQPQMQR